jgi:hypothetical protein
VSSLNSVDLRTCRAGLLELGSLAIQRPMPGCLLGVEISAYIDNLP